MGVLQLAERERVAIKRNNPRQGRKQTTPPNNLHIATPRVRFTVITWRSARCTRFDTILHARLRLYHLPVPSE